MAKSGASLFLRRGPMYFGGLLIGLMAGIGFFYAKRAMMPKFHEKPDQRDEVTISPGGSVHFAYTDDPSYFLIPGLPTGATLYRRTTDGNAGVAMSLSYGPLVDSKDPTLGPITEEGNYSLVAEFYICAGPGVPDCTKLLLNQEIHVSRNAALGEDRLAIHLTDLAQEGLHAGPADEGAPPPK